MELVDKHTSKSFDEDLNEIISRFVEMGRLVSEQVTESTHALIDEDDELAQKVIMLDDEVDQHEIYIDERIILLVAKRQLAATDLRLVMALSKGVVDLERVGDEATKIAEMARQLIQNSAPQQGNSEVQHMSNQARLMLLDALDAFIHMDAHQALAILRSARDIEVEHQSSSRALMTYVMEDSRQVSKVINLLWVLRALERIGEHACNIAEYVIYCASGTDVRHADYDAIEEAVKRVANDSDAKKNDKLW